MYKLPSVTERKNKSKTKGKFIPSKTTNMFSKIPSAPLFNPEVEKLQNEINLLQGQVDEKDSELTYLKKVYKKNLDEKDSKIEVLIKEIDRLKEANRIFQENLRNEVYLKLDDQLKLNEKEKIILNEELLEEKEKLQKKKQKHKQLKEEFKKLNDEFNQLNQKYREKVGENNPNLNEDTKNLIENYKAQINSQELKIESNSEEIKNLYTENKKLKRLAKLIIEQRNETEVFFIEALDEVKRELYSRKKEMAKRGNFFPTLKKKYEVETDKIDIRTLGPDSREQVLRNLFMKINNTYDPEKYKQLNFIMSSDIENENIEF